MASFSTAETGSLTTMGLEGARSYSPRRRTNDFLGGTTGTRAMVATAGAANRFLQSSLRASRVGVPLGTDTPPPDAPDVIVAAFEGKEEQVKRFLTAPVVAGSQGASGVNLKASWSKDAAATAAAGGMTRTLLAWDCRGDAGRVRQHSVALGCSEVSVSCSTRSPNLYLFWLCALPIRQHAAWQQPSQ